MAYHYGIALFFCRSDSRDFLAVPKPFRKVFLDEFYSSLLAGHFGARKVCSLLSGHVW